MPHFETFYADKLRGALRLTDAETVLDLREASAEAAASAVRDMIEKSRRGSAASVAILLSPPPEGGGQTLFQPIGKALLEARKSGWIDSLQTLPAQDGLGFYVVLSGQPTGA